MMAKSRVLTVMVLLLSSGNTKVLNSGVIEGTQNGIYVSGNAKVDITNSGSLGVEMRQYFCQR